MTNSETIQIETSKLKLSPLNPRQSINGEPLKELTASIKQHGIINPLLVRPTKNDHYEVVCGGRRWRAAVACKLQTVPVHIRELDDAQARQIGLIDNLQREDLPPLEEAEAFKGLLENSDVSSVAALVGKSAKYVAQRLQLLSLVEALKKSLTSGKLMLSAALMLARLQPKDQEHFHKENRGDAITVSNVANWTERNVLLPLEAATFDKKDATLQHKAGACTDCPKRSGNAILLFPDVRGKDVCTDRTCFNSKVAAHLQRLEAQCKKEGTTLVKISAGYSGGREGVYSRDALRIINKGDTCPSAVMGVVVLNDFDHRPPLGATMPVCVDQKCKVHWRRTSSGPARKASRAEVAQNRKQRAALSAKLLATREIVLRIKRKPRLDALLPFIATAVASRITHDAAKGICAAFGEVAAKGKAVGFPYREKAVKYLQSTNRAEQIAALAAAACVPDFGWAHDPDAGKRVEAIAKVVGINLKKLERDELARISNPKRKATAKGGRKR